MTRNGTIEYTRLPGTVLLVLSDTRNRNRARIDPKIDAGFFMRIPHRLVATDTHDVGSQDAAAVGGGHYTGEGMNG